LVVEFDCSTATAAPAPPSPIASASLVVLARTVSDPVVVVIAASVPMVAVLTLSSVLVPSPMITTMPP
jgi:hypothetical protein